MRDVIQLHERSVFAHTHTWMFLGIFAGKQTKYVQCFRARKCIGKKRNGRLALIYSPVDHNYHGKQLIVGLCKTRAA